jgi:hypothetical protein
MKDFIKHNWMLLVLGIFNLIIPFIINLNIFIVLNGFAAGSCITLFIIGLIYSKTIEIYEKTDK